MPRIDPQAARQFAMEVVTKLRAAGYEALWAGGCVRDGLLNRTPKDYDVATSALPEQVRDVFGRRRTLPIGQSFGVITVLGPKDAGQIEVATFRRDATYSDGRHPDSVSFSTAEFDAQRRDFTMNGLFYDPLAERVIDYVGGQADLACGIVRAIGNPAERFAEDKLRMLRAVRFAATFGFQLDAHTLAAIQTHAQELVIVSAERVAEEMRRMLVHPNRALALRLLQEANLLEVILPESAAWLVDDDGRHRWQQTLAILGALAEPTFTVAMAAVVRSLRPEEQSPSDLADQVCRRWKLANEEREGVAWLLEQEMTIRQASGVSWPKLQRVLIEPRIEELLDYSEAICKVVDGDSGEVGFCRQRLALPRETLDPPPLVDGSDLKALNLSPGPRYKELLTSVRDAQLVGKIGDRAEALAHLRQLIRDSG